MKSISLSLLLLLLWSCQTKQKNQPDNPPLVSSESLLDSDSADSLYFTDKDIEQYQLRQQTIKKKNLLASPDDKLSLQEMIISKKVYKEADSYILDYTYPYLNETVDPGFKVFNTYMTESYLNLERTINEILEDKELLCDTLKIDRFREKRIIDYKLHSTANNVISILLYKENFYGGMKHSAYLFDCLNFDAEKDAFVYFEDIFKAGAEDDIFALINTTISNEISSGEMYFGCWELTPEDFKAYKNNFVINDENIEFYFDDCVICPSYTGTYSIDIPIIKLVHLLRYNELPILG